MRTRKERARRAPPLELDETAGLLQEMVESVKEQRRAQELRGLANQLRREAMLVDVAAAVGEERARELSRRAHELNAARLTELGQGIFPQ